MGLLLKTADIIYAFRFLRLLTTPFQKTTAFELGLIDKDGRQIREPKSSKETGAYNLFHRLVFNIKKLMGKVPGGKSTIASYLAALYLLKEHTGMSEKTIRKCLDKADLTLDEGYILSEASSTWFLLEDNNTLRKGNYILLIDAPMPGTGKCLAQKNSVVEAQTALTPVGDIFGVKIYEVFHHKTGMNIRIPKCCLSAPLV